MPLNGEINISASHVINRLYSHTDDSFDPLFVEVCGSQGEGGNTDNLAISMWVLTI